MHFSTLFLYGGLVRFGLTAYTVKDSYDSSNWLNMFTFDTEDDPTHGYVNYVDQNTAQNNGLFKVDNNVVTFGVDHDSVASGRGRDSIRLTSKNQYNHALVVIDLAHMPGSVCGSWPAFWMVGPNWPSSGEIDIIEGVNTQSENKMTMHTSDGCSMAGNSCQGNQGCSQDGGGPNSYGSGFNSNNGGVYAMEWTSDHIDIWFFGRGSEPEGVSGDSPDPSGWGPPTKSFNAQDGCDIDSHFQNHNIVFDTTFCGDWAGQVFSQDSTCSALASNCEDYVKNNPQAFTESFWAVNSLKVYSSDGSANPIQPSSETSSNPTAPVISSSISTISADASSSVFFDNSTATITGQPISGTGISPGSPFVATLLVTSGVVTETAAPTTIVYTVPAGGHHGHHFNSPPQVKRAHRAARHLKHHSPNRFVESS